LLANEKEGVEVVEGAGPLARFELAVSVFPNENVEEDVVEAGLPLVGVA